MAGLVLLGLAKSFAAIRMTGTITMVEMDSDVWAREMPRRIE